MEKTRDRLFCLTLEGPRETVLQAEARLRPVWPHAAAWLEEERDSGRLEWYLPCRQEAEHRRLLLGSALRGLRPRGWSVSIRSLAARDWSESWKRFHPTRRVSPRIVIRPSWRQDTCRTRPSDVVLRIDPGMSFGTGLHPTTRACLRLLDTLSLRSPGGALLDVGTGSGILAIAAAKLGYGPVCAIDHDPLAVSVARANARRNGVDRRIRFLVSDLRTWRPDRQWDVVVANLLAPLLLACASRLARAVPTRRPGALIVSGLLTGQYDPVVRRYQSLGFSAAHAIQDNGWTTGCLRSGTSPTRGRGKLP